MGGERREGTSSYEDRKETKRAPACQHMHTRAHTSKVSEWVTSAFPGQVRAAKRGSFPRYTAGSTCRGGCALRVPPVVLRWPVCCVFVCVCGVCCIGKVTTAERKKIIYMEDVLRIKAYESEKNVSGRGRIKA